MYCIFEQYDFEQKNVIFTQVGMEEKTYVPGFHDETAVSKMKYNGLGNTGMRASVLSLGKTFHTIIMYIDMTLCVI